MKYYLLYLKHYLDNMAAFVEVYMLSADPKASEGIEKLNEIINDDYRQETI